MSTPATSTTYRNALREAHREALRRAVLFAQGGEFAFVLYSEALRAGVMQGEIAASMTAITNAFLMVGARETMPQVPLFRYDRAP